MQRLLLILACIAALANAQSVGQQVSSIFASETQSQFSAGENGQWLREAHAKQHGCVIAYVTPNNDLSSSLAQGIFADNHTYPAFIRFSNGVGRGFLPLSSPNGANESDAVPDIRGMGLKLFNVSGPFITPGYNTQCFTLTTDNVGFLDSDESAIGFFTAVQSGKLALTAWLAENPGLASHFLGQATSGIIDDLLSTTWNQAVPQMHGSVAAKYRIYPCDSSRAKSFQSKGVTLFFDYLREQLQSDLSNGDVCLNWAVQFYANEQSTPINDSTVAWTTPFYDIATISIPAQDFGTPGQEGFCGAMSFNPAASIAAHTPIGSTQAIRQVVYTTMATLRHKLSGQSQADATYQNWLDYPNIFKLWDHYNPCRVMITKHLQCQGNL